MSTDELLNISIRNVLVMSREFNLVIFGVCFYSTLFMAIPICVFNMKAVETCKKTTRQIIDLFNPPRPFMAPNVNP